ncbi:MAG TPA: hypothetical protein VFJ74_12335 [Gemmatimonadaceae bacterium]|nr:hypothetical protein [Gemmatimonadaceae bacterium]
MRERDEWQKRIDDESAAASSSFSARSSASSDGDGTAAADDPVLERFAQRIAAPLRAAERADPTFKARLMASVRAESHVAVAAVTSAVPWYRRSVSVRLTPLGGLASLAAAASIAAVAFLGGRSTATTPGVERAVATTATGTAPTTPDTVRVVQFVFVAPGAKRVTLVGDFNGWDRDATQLRPGGARGLWTVALPLPAGRHEYAFVVDGTRWEADPAAAATAVTDDFGVVTSVVSVDGPPRPGTS